MSPDRFEPVADWHRKSMRDPAFRAAYKQAQYEADHAYTEVCILGNCETYWYGGRNIGGVGLMWAPGLPGGCRHRQVSKRLHGAYRLRVLARKRRRR